MKQAHLERGKTRLESIINKNISMSKYTVLLAEKWLGAVVQNLAAATCTRFSQTVRHIHNSTVTTILTQQFLV